MLGVFPCRLETRIQKAEKRGVKAVIYAHSGYAGGYGWLGYFLHYDLERVKSSIPVIEVAYYENQDIYKKLKDASNEVTTVMFDGMEACYGSNILRQE